MSISQILLLIDEEISRLEQARAILAEMAAPRKPRTRRPAASEAALEVSPITIVAPRGPAQHRIRNKQQFAQQANALSGPVPTGAVAVSAVEAAKGRTKPVISPQQEIPRWLPSRSIEKLTMNDLFHDFDESEASSP